MKPKVSIIVPIYNMEKYLNRCLDSLTGQTLREIEILAVNDGSTDSSLEILERYAHHDKRIKIIDKLNGGVSSARNEGIRNAKGEFIGFVDPDDWVDPQMYEALYRTAIQDHSDVVMCSYIREFGSHSKEKDFRMPDKVVYRHDEVREKILRRIVGPLNEEVGNPEMLDAWGTVWSKIYRSALINEHNITFTDLKEIGTNEDSLFNIQVFVHADSFIFLNMPYYHYWRANIDSVTTGYKPDLFNQWFHLFSIIDSLLKERKLGPKFFEALNNRICLGILGLGLNAISKNNTVPFVDKLKILNSYLNDDRMKRSFEQLELSSFPIVWKAFYFCAKARLSWGLYFLLVSVDGLRKVRR
jgi:glycosyltransferase involved in cell wall biosynthesis